MKISKTHFFLFFVLFAHLTYTQTKTGKAIYSYVTLNHFESNNPKPELQNIVDRLTEGYGELEFILKFDKDISSFSVVDDLGLDLDFGGLDDVVYTTSNEIFRDGDFEGTRYIVKSKLKTKWILHKETRKFGEFIAYRATFKKHLRDKHYRDITAWYCPSIPSSFGPAGFGGLPGLILQLNFERREIYTIKKIILHTEKEVVVNLPTKGKFVTEEEFEEIARKAFANLVNSN